jgi:hypothetical protein
MSVKKRKCLSVREKVEIIRELEHGEINADETGLFYNMTPDTAFKFKGEKYVSGKKLFSR